jgi:hypothetical protein
MQYGKRREGERTCDWCCGSGHYFDECPHLAKQLLDPSEKGNGIRAYFAVIDDALEQAGQSAVTPQIISLLDTTE